MVKTMKNKRATALGGLGIALFLCVLMALMPFAGVVENTSDEITNLVENKNPSTDDVFKLPDQYRPVGYDTYDPAQELVGMRSVDSKSYLDDEGKTTMITTAGPMHYLEDGVWEEIDLNIVSVGDGWEVKKNTFETEFSEDLNHGVSIDVPNDNIGAIYSGINPQVTMIDETGKEITEYKLPTTKITNSIGGQTLRYHLSQDFDLDYSVNTDSVKQELIIRERPNAELLENFAWFGLTEEMIIPDGYALYLMDDMNFGQPEMITADQLIQTQSGISIMNIQTGEPLAFIPEPMVTQADSPPDSNGVVDSQEEYIATYFIRYVDNTIIISTMVEVDWLLSDERAFPISIDPTIGPTDEEFAYFGTCKLQYYGRCYKRSTGTSWTRFYVASSSSSRYGNWNTFFPAAIPPSATIEEITLSIKLRYYKSGNNWNAGDVDIVLMQDCGTPSSYYASVHVYPGDSFTCTDDLIDSSISGSYSYYNQYHARSGWSSDAVASHDFIALGTQGTVVTGDVCNSVATCATGVAASASANYYSGTNIGAAFHMDAMKGAYNNNQNVRQAYGSHHVPSVMSVTYTTVTDTSPPSMTSSAYDGVTSYVEGTRTMFATFFDESGIDTTSGNEPTLHYTTDQWSTTNPVSASIIGTCANNCVVKAQIPALSAGDDVEYYWTTSDTKAYTLTTDTYTFSVADVTAAPVTDMKLQILSEGVNSAKGTYHNNYYDRQLTYWEGANEYLHEWDTSDCGSAATNSDCFETGATVTGCSPSYHCPNWQSMQTPNPNAADDVYWNQQGVMTEYHIDNGGVLTIDEAHGPNMNLLYWYNTTESQWVLTGIGDGSTGITDRVVSATVAPTRANIWQIDSHLVPVPTSFTTAMFGEFSLEDTGTTTQSTKANWICVNSHGWTYFFRSTSLNPNCYPGMPTNNGRGHWSGFSLGQMEDQYKANYYATSYKDTKIAPEPDTSEPWVVHTPMTDSHSVKRTFTFEISEKGNPASGLDIGASAGAQPTLYYEISAPGATPSGTWTEILLQPEGGNANNCVMTTCKWSHTIDDIGERGSTVTYYASARDTSILGGALGSSANVNETLPATFEVGTPTMQFIVEWHDLTNPYGGLCSYQAVFYDVTNEIEFHYSDDCEGTFWAGILDDWYNHGAIGYQDQTRTHGATIRDMFDTLDQFDGTNPHLSNFRISTGASGANSWESFERGMVELTSWDEHMPGTAGGGASSSQCANQWSTNSYSCNANIDMPDNFDFNYFGTLYDGSNNDSRVHIGRLGNMYFSDNPSTALEQSFAASWYNNMITIPNDASMYSEPGMIAPYMGYYENYQCYDSSTSDCSIRTRTIPFEGGGTDVSDTQWTHKTYTIIDSPIRIDPSAGNYLAFMDGLTVEEGVVFQIASGKGISIDGTCSQLKAIGSADDVSTDDGPVSGHITFEGVNAQTWLGIAFTGHCSTDTDDRHQMSYVDIKDTSMAAISAGSRHGNHAAGQPTTNANAGNFSMDHVTFDNVAKAFSHGSGDGTVIEMNNYSISNAWDTCLDFAKDSVVTLSHGVMDTCNANGNSWGGAIVDAGSLTSVPPNPSTKGSLTVENLTVTNSYKNLIDVDFAAVWLQNVSATVTAGASGDYAGYALKSEGRGTSGDAAWCGLYGSCTYVNNLEVTGGVYDSGLQVSSATSYHLENIALEGGQVLYDYPGLGDVPTNAKAFMENITAGDIRIEGGSVPGTMGILSVGDIVLVGDAVAGSGTIDAEYWNATGEIRIDGACGWNINLEHFTARRMAFSCTSANNKNQITVSNGYITHTVPNSVSINAFFVRNSVLTVGETTVESPYIGNYHWNEINAVAELASGGEVRMIAVDLLVDFDGDTVVDTTVSCTTPTGVVFAQNANNWNWAMPGDCPINQPSPSSSAVWFGDLAYVTLAKEQAGITVNPPDHYVKAVYIDDGFGALDFEIGLTKTLANGTAINVWVITADENGDPISLHSLHAWGSAGENDTTPSDGWYPGCDDTNNDDICDVGSTPSYGAGDSITLNLEPVPVSLNATSGNHLTCQDLGEHEDAGPKGSGTQPYVYETGETFTFDAAVTMEVDVTLDDCQVVIMNKWSIVSTSTSPTTLTIGPGGSFSIQELGGTQGNLRSKSASDPGFVVVEGTLELDNGKITNMGYRTYGTGTDAYTSAIELGSGASMSVTSSSSISGLAATPDAILIHVGKDSSFNLANSVISASGGIALKFNEAATLAEAHIFTISGADVGISSVNALAQISGYTLTDNDVGISVMNMPPPPPPPPVCDFGYGYYGSWWGLGTNPVSCSATLPTGKTLNIKLITDYWGYESVLTVELPDGSSDYAPPGTFASQETYDPWVTYTAPGVYNIILDDTYGDGGMVAIATVTDGGGPVVEPPLCEIGGSGWQWGSEDTCTFTLDANRAFELILDTWWWSYEASVKVEVSTDGGSSWTTLYQEGPYFWWNTGNYPDPVTRVLGTFDTTGDYKLTIGDSYGDGGQALTAILLPAQDLIASFTTGIITGFADTGISVGATAGEPTYATFDDVTISSPAGATAFQVAGWTKSVTVNDLTVTGGDYGIDVAVTSSGNIAFTNVDISGTLHSAVFYQNDMTATVDGTIGSNTGAAIKYGPYTSADVTLDSLALSNNGIGLEAQGEGTLTVTNSVFTNPIDVEISDSSTVIFVDGTVADVDVATQIVVTGTTGSFERARGFDYTLTADIGSGAAALADVNIIMLDENQDLASTGETDVSGIAGLIFNTYTVDDNGQKMMTLADYSVSTVAEVEYTSTVADFRYITDTTLGLTDANGNAKSVELVDNIDYRVCSKGDFFSPFTYQDSETNMVDCNWWSGNSKTFDQRSVGVSSTITEQYWNGGIGNGNDWSYTYTDWTNSAVQLDSGNLLLSGSATLDLTESEVFVTGGDTDWRGRTQWVRGDYPYNAGIVLDHTNVMALAVDDVGRMGFEIGQYHSVDISITDSVINGVGGIHASSYPYVASISSVNPDFSVTGSTLVHFEPIAGVTPSTSFYQSDSCLWIGTPNAVATGNTLIGCPAGVMVGSPYWSYFSNPGADDSIIEDNAFIDMPGLQIWFVNGAFADDVVIRNNNMTGSVEALYGVYGQGVTSGENMIIDDNKIWNAKEAIYMRGPVGWEITNNEIHGTGDSSYTGIYAKEAYGVITGNTLINADGGILVDGAIAVPPSKDVRCYIGSGDYNIIPGYEANCTFDLAADEFLNVRLQTDYWSASEGELLITKPDGTSDEWTQGMLPNSGNYNPFVVYNSSADPSLIGTFTIDVTDSWGDGGQTVEAYVNLGGADTDSVVITDNTIRTSEDRTAPSAVGIWIENCVGGTGSVTSSGNNITVLENALVTNGCDITDTGSNYTAAGGTGGTVYTVNVNADNYAPATLSIQEGDTIRWRAIEYYDHDNNPLTSGQPHDVTSNNTGPAGLWGSPYILNLGATYAKTFTGVGTEDYHCSVHPWMTGTIIVGANTGQTLSSTGINILGATDDVVLDGTTVGGFDLGVEMSGGELHLTGDAFISGDSKAVSMDAGSVTSDGASLYANPATGTALHAAGSATVDLIDLDVAGFRGLHTNNSFAWNGGSSTATTTLYTAASGKIENMSWAGSATMIDAMGYARILSVANNLVDSQLLVGPNAVIDEGNLFNLNVTHLGAEYPAPGESGHMGLVIQSHDNMRSEYTSSAYRSGIMEVNGDMSDWTGEFESAPFDDASPGLMSGTASDGFYLTFDENNLYIAVTGVDFDTAGELQIYFDSSITGSSQSSEGVGAVPHNLPFNADFAFGVTPSTDYGMMLPHSLLGWLEDAACTGVNAHMGSTTNDNVTEIRIPVTCLDPDSKEIRILALVQGATDVTSVYPSQTLVNDGTGENFDESMSLVDETDNLNSGVSLRNHILIYRSYVGSTTPSDAKTYDVDVKVDVACEQDWGEITDISMANANVWAETDILRACPEFTNLDDLMTVDEDSADNIIDLGTKAVDAQDTDATTLLWEVNPSSVSSTMSPTQLLSFTQIDQSWVISLNPDQHSESPNGGAYHFEVSVTDSNGLSVDKTITYNVNNVNDKPIIKEEGVAIPVLTPATSSVDSNGVTTFHQNFLTEGSVTFWYDLGHNATNGTIDEGVLTGLIWDMLDDETMAYELNQEYTWGVDLEAGCEAFTAMVDANGGLDIIENSANQDGGYCDITLSLSDGFDDADEVVITLGVIPVNNAPEILTWDPDNGIGVYDGNGVVIAEDLNSANAPWKINLTEDDESTSNLTFNLSAMKTDVDHNSEDVYWTVTKGSTCDYEDFFTIDIVGDLLTIDLIKDATTTAQPWDVDYFQDADGDGSPDEGIHQSDIGWCPILVNLFDSADAPSYHQYYDTALMPPANYSQESAQHSLEVRVVNVAENVPDYFFDVTNGFDFHGVNYIIDKTYVPTTVTIGAAGDEGPYNYDHMIEVCMMSDGHTEAKECDTMAPPEHGETFEYTTDVLLTRTTNEVWIEMDVLTCVDDPCDLNKASKDRFWSYSYPQVHSCVDSVGVLGEKWSCSGYAPKGVLFLEDGSVSLVPLASKRAPMLEDGLWCNNVMSTNTLAEDCNQYNIVLLEEDDYFLASGQSLPIVVSLIQSASVPSFAPSIIVISAAGMFVSALVLSSRREDDEAELEETLVDNESAVSPVIATILMVAITVVLSGVVYVWASSLADTSGGKGVPRFTFDLHSENALNSQDPYYGFSVMSSETDLATQSMFVTVFYTNSTGGTSIVSYGLAETTVYGFGPTNSDSMVTYGDAPETDTGEVISTFNTGDRFYVKTQTADGYDFSGDGFQVQLSYVPGGSGDQGSVLRVWDL